MDGLKESEPSSGSPARGVSGTTGSEQVRSYDVHKMPASIDDAELHYKCNRYGSVSKTAGERRVCPCCLNPETNQHPATVSTDDIVSSGAIIPLFFQYSRLLIVITAFLAILALSNLFFIAKSNCFPQTEAPNYLSLRTRGMIICDKTISTIVNPWMAIAGSEYLFACKLAILAVLALTYFGFRKMNRDARRLEDRIDSHHQTPSSYAVMVYGLKPEQQTKQYIEGYINSYLETTEVEVVKFTVARHDCQIFILQLEQEELTQKRNSMEKYLRELEQQGVQSGRIKAQVDSLGQQIAKADNSLQTLKKKFSSPTFAAMPSIAYVTVNNPDHVRRVQKKYTAWLRLKWLFHELLGSCGKKQEPSSPFHLMKQAPEPDDSIWQNLDAGRVRNVAVSLVSVVLVLCFIYLNSRLMLLVLEKRNQIAVETANSFLNSLMQTVLNILAGAVVTVSNILLNKAYLYLAHFELPASQSGQTNSITVKLFILQFTNTFLTARYNDSRTKSQNLPYHLFSIEVSNLLLTPVLTAVSASHLFKLWKKRMLSQQLRNQEPVLLTQKELNGVFDPQDHQIHIYYCSLMRSFAVAVSNLFTVPALMIFSLVYQMIQYRVNKYMVIYHYKKIDKMKKSYHHSIISITTLSMFGAVLELAFVEGSLGLFGLAVAAGFFLVVVFLKRELKNTYDNHIQQKESNLGSSDDKKSASRKAAQKSIDESQILQELYEYHESELLTYDQVCHHFDKDYEACDPSQRFARKKTQAEKI